VLFGGIRRCDAYMSVVGFASRHELSSKTESTAIAARFIERSLHRMALGSTQILDEIAGAVHVSPRHNPGTAPR
jgi:hypothetical protein